MKNFTKQNFKTNPLWIRLLIMTFMVLLSTGSAWAANIDGTIYFEKPSSWSGTDIYFCIGKSGWSDFDNKMTHVCGNYYKITIKWDGATKIGFTDCNLSSWSDGDSDGGIDGRYNWVCNNKTPLTNSLGTGRMYYISNGSITYKTQTSDPTCCSAPTSVSITRGTPTTGNICQGSTIDLTATVDGSGDITYEWTKTSGSSDWTIANASAQKCTVTAGTGSATFQIKATRCSTSKTSTVTLTADPKSALTLKANPTICQGSSIVLSNYVESSIGTVKWYSNSARTTEITNPTEARTPQSSPTSYYARATSGVCSSVDKTLTVTLSPKPAIELTSSTATICNGDEITLASYVKSSTGTVKWYTNDGMTTEAAAKVKPTSNATYYAKASSGDCTPATASLQVTVNDKPATPTLTPATVSLVSPETATLTAGNTTNGLTYTLYNGNAAGESKKSTGSDLTFTVSAAGSYTVKVTNDCGTSTSTAVTVTVCTPQVNEFKHANSSYTQLANQPTYYPGDKAYFVSIYTCCLTGSWSTNLNKGEEAWFAGLTGGTPKFSMTLTRAGNFTITNNATNGCTETQDVKVNLDFKVTALPEVTNTNGTASGSNIALTWKHATSHTNVMVVRYPTSGTETIPAGGQAYTAGNALGEGKVVYVGTAESFTDTNLAAGAGYKYYFYTVNNNYYSEGVVLNMSSCAIPAKPQLSSTPVTACDGTCTAQGYIIIGNMSDYDDTDTFKLGNGTVTPTAEGKLGINSTAYTQYTVTVTNSCGNSNNAQVDIAINDNKPTITGATYTQPGKDNAIELTLPAGISAKWSVSPAADLSVGEGNSTMFSAEENGTYTITADNKGCTDTHVVTVSDAFYVYMRQPKKGETAYDNFYYPTQNPTQGGDLFYKEYASIPPAEGYTDYNTGGVARDIIFTDCDGYVWYGFKASDKLIDGTNYFTVRAPNKGGNGGYYTHTYLTKPGAMTSDIYYTMSEEASNNSRGWYITKVSAPYSGPVVHASGKTSEDFSFNKNNFADFVALYVKDCSGKEVKSYQWQYSATENGEYADYSSVCTYVGKKTEQGDAGKTNNIRPNVAGWYRCIANYIDGSSTTSSAKQVTATSGTTYSFTSDLPIIMVNTNGYGFPSCDGLSGTASKNADVIKAKISVDVKIYEKTNLVYDRKARMNYRGSSSLNFVKKSYAFCPGKADCVEDKGREDYVKTEKLNMLGVGQAVDKDWVLYAAAADPTIMRNRLMFDTFRDMTGGWSVQSRYVELIVDGEYKGVYVFMDKITNNEKRVNITNENGFILKFDKTDIADRYENDGDKKTFKSLYSGKDGSSTYDTEIDQRFEIEYPEKEDIEDEGGNWATTVNNIKSIINNFETQLKARNYGEVQKIIDYKSWADWFIITEFGKNMDAYRASNLFVYNGDKLEARPLWDQELSFKNTCATLCDDYGCDNTEGLLIRNSKIYSESESCAAPFWFTGKYVSGRGTEAIGGSQQFAGYLLDDPCFVQTVKDRWAYHKENALKASELNAKITAYTNEMATALDREKAMWKSEGGKLSRETCQCSFGGTTGYSDIKISDSKSAITSWINSRPSKLDAALADEVGTGLSILFSHENVDTTPWEPVVIQVISESGYDYKLEYTDNSLDKVTDVIIEKNADTYKYHIPRPAKWDEGNEKVEGERADIVYGLKATLLVGEGVAICGAKEDGSEPELPFDEATITLQDEPNEVCE